MIGSPRFDLHKPSQQSGVKNVVVVEAHFPQAIALTAGKVQPDFRLAGLRIDLERALGELTIKIPETRGAVADHLPQGFILTMVEDISQGRALRQVGTEAGIVRGGA